MPEQRKWVWRLGLHLLLGLALAYWRPLSTWWGAGAFFYFLLQTLRSRNRTGMAHLGAAYIVGLEVLLRMTKAALFWEFGKLACITLLVVGLLVEGRRHYRWGYLSIAVLLLPALFLGTEVDFSRFRQHITFQLGGMILLSLSCVYFAARRMGVAELQQLFRYSLWPIGAMVAYLFAVTPQLAQIEFTFSANFAASGGYGPNQVSTILGWGMLLLAVNFLLRWPPLFSRFWDIALLVALAFRALLTFSRGGVLGFFVAIFVAYTIYLLSNRQTNRRYLLVRWGLVMGTIVLLFAMVNQLTGELLIHRFRGETMAVYVGDAAYSLDKATSGRSRVIQTDWQMWLDHPVWGVGVGMSNVLRPQYGYANISHLEQTRLLAEHGLLGIWVLLLLVGAMVWRTVSGAPISKFMVLAFSLFSFLTMFHSATRLAVVGFAFGLGLVHVYANYSLSRQSPFEGRGVSFGGRKPGALAGA